MGVREGAAEYARQHGKEPEVDLQTLAGTKLGLGKVRHMAQSGDEKAKQVLRDLKVTPPDPTTAYDA